MNKLSAILGGILAAIAVLFGAFRHGKNKGKEELQNENNKQNIEDIRSKQNLERTLDNLPRDKLRDRVSKYERET